MVRLLVLSIFVFLPISQACFSSGVCVTCPQPQPSCGGGGCRGGYSCGQYGCYRARAASSKIVEINDQHRVDPKFAEVEKDEEEEEQKEEFYDSLQEESVEPEPKGPNEKFLDCCIHRNLPDECLNKCSFETYTRDALQAMYFRMDRCPMQAAAELQFCAAQGKNHQECCTRNGVGHTLVGAKCLTFCDQRSGNVTQLDFSYLACFDKFDSMKGCFWFDITREESKDRKFGDYGRGR
ncbi:hypothetical protein L596_021927 [Steinernema carpocapsae]|uniref:Domain of unknown function DB domain-containing protein n=1 Tax=Steinernema carpocapsae TaxID=34508 RepID=A0A4V6A027_STECR|nr:hypothetical protein L596_021927 [Steinernema carpocapsae]